MLGRCIVHLFTGVRLRARVSNRSPMIVLRRLIPGSGWDTNVVTGEGFSPHKTGQAGIGAVRPASRITARGGLSIVASRLGAGLRRDARMIA